MIREPDPSGPASQLAGARAETATAGTGRSLTCPAARFTWRSSGWGTRRSRQRRRYLPGPGRAGSCVRVLDLWPAEILIRAEGARAGVSARPRKCWRTLLAPIGRGEDPRAARPTWPGTDDQASTSSPIADIYRQSDLGTRRWVLAHSRRVLEPNYMTERAERPARPAARQSIGRKSQNAANARPPAPLCADLAPR